MNIKTLRNRIFKAMCGIAALAVILGCATTISYRSQRPPTWNTLGIQRLAVMPFTTSGYSTWLQSHAANVLTNEARSRIQSTNHFTIVNSSEIEQRRTSGDKIENFADGLFGGQVISVTVNESSTPMTRKNRDGETVHYTLYQRDVALSFNFYLTRVRDAVEIGSEIKNLSESDSNENRTELRTAQRMIEEMVRRALADVTRYLLPYYVTEQLTLENETSRDKEIKQRAKDAAALVKQGNYGGAQEAYLSIYRDTGSFAAGYNAGLLIEVQGRMEDALRYMQNLYRETGNAKIMTAISRLQRTINNSSLLQAYRDNRTPRDRVVDYMVNALPSHMSAGARVALVSNSRNERDIVESVIDGITRGLLEKNIIVVDRNNRTLVEMERNYQLSGNVSDEDMISIGHEAGVNTFILVSILGSGGTRRLSVKMLDVERNTIIFQSPQSDEMNL